jgi:hypothetical protein
MFSRRKILQTMDEYEVSFMTISVENLTSRNFVVKNVQKTSGTFFEENPDYAEIDPPNGKTIAPSETFFLKICSDYEEERSTGSFEIWDSKGIIVLITWSFLGEDKELMEKNYRMDEFEVNSDFGHTTIGHVKK